jgi:hypothetical protein
VKTQMSRPLKSTGLSPNKAFPGGWQLLQRGRS